MPLLDRHPPHVRHSIALVVTIGVAIILVMVLVILYTRKRAPEDKPAPAAINDFYTTILDSAQSSPDAQ